MFDNAGDGIMSQCQDREKLLKGVGTAWGRWRWERHVRKCPLCAEAVKVEQEITRLFERAGEWQECPEFVRKIKEPKGQPILVARRRDYIALEILAIIILVVVLGSFYLFSVKEISLPMKLREFFRN